MYTREQQAVLRARERALSVMDQTKGTLADRLAAASSEIQLLASAIGVWVDNTAFQYKALGCELEEWRDDIRSWFIDNQFYVDDDINDGAMLRCHLSNVGWGRHVIMSFRLGPPRSPMGVPS